MNTKPKQKQKQKPKSKPSAQELVAKAIKANHKKEALQVLVNVSLTWPN